MGGSNHEAAPRYRGDIDGMRAIAVTAVVLFHIGLPAFGGGFIGVDLFYVISGFLIGGILHREMSAGSFSFGEFYARRARRILPALLVVVLASTIASLVLMSGNEAKRFGVSAASALLGVSNIRFWLETGYFTPDAAFDPMLMTWSLGVEEQFYLIAPALMLLVHRFRPNALIPLLVALILGSLALSVLLSSRLPAFAFYLIPTRAWEMGAGVLLAIWRAHGRLQIDAATADVTGFIGLSLCIGAVVFLPEGVPFPGIAAALPVGGALLLLVSERGMVNRIFLASAPMRLIGLTSYSWYLWHWPINAFIRLCSPLGEPKLALLAAAFISFGCGYLSWRFIEQRYRRSRTPQVRLFIRYAAAVAGVATMPVAMIATQGASARLTSQLTRAEDVLTDFHGGQCLADFPTASADLGPSCNARSAGREAIVLIGDSHAAALGPGLRHFAATNGIGYSIYAKSSCRPLTDVTVWRRSNPALVDTCAHFMLDAIDRAANDKQVRYVMLAGLWGGPLIVRDDERLEPVDPRLRGRSASELLEVGLTRTIERLKRAGKLVIVVEDVPHWRFDPARIVATAAIPLRARAARLNSGVPLNGVADVSMTDDYVRMGNRIVAEVARATGADFLRTYARFCDPGRCRFMAEGKPLFVDRSHLSDSGAIIAFEGFVLPAQVSPSEKLDPQ